MSLERFLQTIESGIQDLTEGWWRDDPEARLWVKADRLNEELGRRYSLLVRQRAVVEEVRHRLAENERWAAQLAERVEVYLHVADRENSWKHALELDRTRQAVEQERAQLQKHEQAYHDQLAEVEQLKRRLADLRQKLYVRQQGHG